MIFQTLTSLRKKQTEEPGRVNIPAELISRLGKLFYKIKIALTSSRKMAKEQPKLMDIQDCFNDDKCDEINQVFRTIGILLLNATHKDSVLAIAKCQYQY